MWGAGVLDISEIIPGRLWVGAYVRPDEIAELQKTGITTVVSMQTDEDLQHCGIAPRELARTYSGSGIDYVRLPTPDFDREGLARDLPATVVELERIMANPASRVYLHCTAGVNRSATAAAGYFIKCRGLSAWEALNYVTSRRSCDPLLDVLEDYAFALSSVGPE